MSIKRRPVVVTAFTFAPETVYAAQVEHAGAEGLRLLNCVRAPRLTNDALSLKALRGQLKAQASLCTTLLNQGEYALHQVQAPNVPRADMAQAVRWKLGDQLGYPPEEAAVDVIEVPNDPNRATEEKHLFAIAARNALVRKRIEDFHAARVPLQAIDVPELAQRNLAHLFEIEKGAVGLLNFGDSGGLLTFVHQGELLVARHIDVTLEQLLQADGTAFEPLMERVALEVQRTYDHVDRRFHFATVARILVNPFPPGHGAVEYLARNLTVRVQQLDLNEVLDLRTLNCAVDALWQTRHLHVIGAALRAQPTAA